MSKEPDISRLERQYPSNVHSARRATRYRSPSRVILAYVSSTTMAWLSIHSQYPMVPGKSVERRARETRGCTLHYTYQLGDCGQITLVAHSSAYIQKLLPGILGLVQLYDCTDSGLAP